MTNSASSSPLTPLLFVLGGFCDLVDFIFWVFGSGISMLMDDDDYSPLFVTWNTRTHRSSSGGGGGGGGGWNTRLRGCIGTFDAQPLRAGLEEYALLSAFRDHRFRRVELRELPSLECGCVPFLQSNLNPSCLSHL
jgi:hypothetical protein